MMYLWVGMLVAYAGLFIYKTKTGSPSLMSKQAEITRLSKYIKPGMRVADLGCGDGEVLRALAERGARGEGWEIEPWYYLRAICANLKEKTGNKVKIHWGDMWRARLSRFELVYVYQLTRYSERFAKKCQREMRPGTLVVANTYPIHQLKLAKKDGKLFLYRI